MCPYYLELQINVMYVIEFCETFHFPNIHLNVNNNYYDKIAYKTLTKIRVKKIKIVQNPMKITQLFTRVEKNFPRNYVRKQRFEQ